MYSSSVPIKAFYFKTMLNNGQVMTIKHYFIILLTGNAIYRLMLICLVIGYKILQEKERHVKKRYWLATCDVTSLL